jgi:hypothetical protein
MTAACNYQRFDLPTLDNLQVAFEENAPGLRVEPRPIARQICEEERLSASLGSGRGVRSLRRADRLRADEAPIVYPGVQFN